MQVTLTRLERKLLHALQVMTVEQELKARRAEWALYDKKMNCGLRKRHKLLRKAA